MLAGTPNGIFRSTDQGVTWTAAADMLPTAWALAVDPINSSNAYAVVQDGGFYSSSNGGVNWRKLNAPFPPQPGAAQIAINTQTPSTIYVWVAYSFYRSTDAGQSWQPLSIPSNSSITGFALAPSDPSVLYAAGLPVNGPLFRSTDGGSTWTQRAVDIFAYGPNSIAVDPADASTLWVVDGGVVIYKSTDGGASFQIAASFGNYDTLDSIVIDPANSAHLYAAGPFAIYQTVDGGKTWSSVGPTLLGATPLLYAAPSHIYIAGSMPPAVFLAKLDATLSQLIYSTYLWAGSVSGIAVDNTGNVYLTGTQVNGTDGVYLGIVMKVNAADSSVLYSTPLNGALGNAIAVDASGNAVIAGTATALSTTKGAYQPVIPGPCPLTPPTVAAYSNQEPTHAFVGKIDPNGALVAATYITGSCGDAAFAIALDSSGFVYVAGETYASDFPVTADAMIDKFPSAYSSGFVAKLSPAEDQLLYSSFIGGGYFSAVHALKLDGSGSVYLAGSTQAPPFAPSDINSPPIDVCATTPGGFGPPLTPAPNIGDNPFVMKMTLSAASPIFFAKVGGMCHGEVDSLALDAGGNIWIAGSNASWDFPSVAPLDGLADVPPVPMAYGFSSPSQQGFIAELDASASTLLSSTLTDWFGAVAADATAVYYAGGLGNRPASGGYANSYAAVVAEIDPSRMAPIVIDKITQDSPLVPASQRLPAAVAPGEIVRIVGRGIGPQVQAGAKLTPAGTLATSIDGVQVTFNGIAAPLAWAQANEVVAIAPFELNGLTTAAVEVQYNGLTSNTYSASVVPQNVDVLAVANMDWSANSSGNPARLGSGIAIFLTGIGQTNPPGSDGAINLPPPALPLMAPPVTIGGDPANVTYFGAAGYEVAGVMQLNLTLPRSNSRLDNLVTIFIGNTAININVQP